MGETVTIAHIKEYSSAYRAWKRLDNDGKRFVLVEVENNVSDKTVKEAIKKWKKQSKSQ